MPSPNIEILQKVVKGLGELKEKVVFIGGSIAELYVSNPVLSEIRPTLDIDCIVEISSRIAYAKLEEDLRAKGFVNDTTNEAPICRWIYKNIQVDVMPSDPKILGFSNRWYDEGIQNKITKILPNGTKIYVFSPEYYLATKFEAHKNRGAKDLRTSQDFEDIVYILDNCDDIFKDIISANITVKEYLSKECKNLLKNNNLIEGIECVLPYGSDSDSTEKIQDLIQNISDIEY
jgi:hypothetical protein